ncbi:ANTAR domain-containing response regulator [Cohnella boryungensis]|jgi:response regulator NasT|uniref:ANTAR domain-containing response regulator n=1 Tax=Cohnella boryungensis TaxID=768479 RepID=A0ABV8SDH7_9BACL
MRSLLVIHNQAPAAARTSPASPETFSPEIVLRSHGYFVFRTRLMDKAGQLAEDADATVLQLPLSSVGNWGSHLLQIKPMPLLWWCDADGAARSLEACEDDIPLDGLLSPSMSGHEIHWALHFASKQFMERRQWLNERQQLLGRIEERKWIDMAKSILCEIKNVTESEAYDILRKQAMNERKRMVDVATSIVKVYQLLQESKDKGAKRR